MKPIKRADPPDKKDQPDFDNINLDIDTSKFRTKEALAERDQAVVDEFRKRRSKLRKIGLITIIILVVGPVILWEPMKEHLQIFLLPFFGGLLFYQYHAFIYWRCPACDRSLPNSRYDPNSWSTIRRCPYCKAAFE